MSYFKYTIKNQHGDTVKGKVEARTVQHAAGILHERGLFVVDIVPVEETGLTFINNFIGKIKDDDIVNFTRQLSTMITAGLTLTESLNILQEQNKKPSMVKMVSEILKDVEGGSSFGDALGKQDKVFDKTFVQLVRAGEIGGVLDEILQRLAENMEKSKEFKAKTKGALVYPAIVMTAMIGLLFIMMIFVVPKLTAMFEDFGAELPLPTRILIGMSGFFQQFWWLMIGLGFGASILFKRWKATPSGAHIWDNLMFKVPVFGELRKKIILTEFSRTISLLLGAGISLLRALKSVSDSSESIIFQEAFEDAAKKIEKGDALSHALELQGVFPVILAQMIRVGEETGKMDTVCMKLSLYYEAETEQAIKVMSTALEPIIMIVLGVSVGFIVFAVIMPIYSLTSQF